MNQDEYLKTRVDDQIAWYGAKSSYNQKRYRWLQVLAIVAGSLIPFLTGYVDHPDYGPTFKILVGSLGVLGALITGLQSLYKFQENWVQYRSTCEALKSEKYLFETQTPPYTGPDALANLVQKVETLISSENKKWTQYITAPAPQPEQIAPPAEPAATDAMAPAPEGEVAVTEPANAAPPAEAAAAPEAEPATPAMQFDPAATGEPAAEEPPPDEGTPAMQFQSYDPKK